MLDQITSRHWSSHKGTYGRVAVVGSDDGMLGATLMAGRAALRSGSGLVTVVSTKSHLDMCAAYQPELMSQCFENQSHVNQTFRQSDVIVLGPGLGRSKWSEKAFDRTMQFNHSMVIDADGLFHLKRSGLKRDNWVLTPHPGEASNLLDCSSEDIQNNRFMAVEEICRIYGGVCVLKGAGTLICDEDKIVSLCNSGNPGMATAGMGDVLSGMIGSFIGQNFNLRQAAEAGVWLHGFCGDKAAREKGEASLIATDVIDHIPGVLKG